MSSDNNDQTYVLWDRRDNVEENLRLNSQHEAITHAILDGQLIHPSINTLSPETNIADLGCGTGVWLGDVARKLLGKGQAMAMATGTLVGFDVNAHAFDPTLPPSVKLIEHDCTQPFEAKYVGSFDLVNIRGLAYAVATEGLSRVVKHAVQLLKPGGYLQWLETETRLFRVSPAEAEVPVALKILDLERQARGLVPFLPHFMLRQLLSADLEDYASESSPSVDTMGIMSFNLRPGGISRGFPSPRPEMDDLLSDILLESMRLFLNASLLRQNSRKETEINDSEGDKAQDEETNIEGLMDYFETARKANTIKMGGRFPQVIAQKAKHS